MVAVSQARDDEFSRQGLIYDLVHIWVIFHHQYLGLATVLLSDFLNLSFQHREFHPGGRSGIHITESSPDCLPESFAVILYWPRKVSDIVQCFTLLPQHEVVNGLVALQTPLWLPICSPIKRRHPGAQSVRIHAGVVLWMSTPNSSRNN